MTDGITTGDHIEAEIQLSDEVSAIIDALAPFVGVREASMMLKRFNARHVNAMVADLVQPDDDQLAAEICLSVMTLLWPRCAPEDCGHADWWQTPLGRLCARSLGRSDAESVSHSVAAAMLGVHRSQIGALVARGKLDRHPDGGVLRASVLQRLGRGRG